MQTRQPYLPVPRERLQSLRLAAPLPLALGFPMATADFDGGVVWHRALVPQLLSLLCCLLFNPCQLYCLHGRLVRRRSSSPCGCYSRPCQLVRLRGPHQRLCLP